MIALLAWKNIWRNPSRSLVVIAATIVGLVGGLLTIAVSKGMVAQRIDAAISTEVSHIQIHNLLYLENKEINDTIPGIYFIENFIKSLPQIKAYSCRTKVAAMVSLADKSSSIILNGVDTEREKQVTTLSKNILDSCGEFFPNNKENEVVIGQKLAEKLNAHLRSKLIFTFQNSAGEITKIPFRVCGIYKTINTSFDEMNAWVHRSALNNAAGFSYNQAHEIALLLTNDSLTLTYQKKIQEKAPGLSVRTWKEIQPDIGMMNDFMDQMLYIIMIILLLAMAFGIINTMLMSVLERTHEIGMLMAIGMGRIQIFYLIFTETLMLLFTGSFAGIGMGYFYIKYLGKSGIDLSNFAEGLEDIGYNPIIYPTLNYEFILGLTALIFLTGTVASIFPARKALKLTPIDAIRQ